VFLHFDNLGRLPWPIKPAFYRAGCCQAVWFAHYGVVVGGQV
jgi:hypothetical protein